MGQEGPVSEIPPQWRVTQTLWGPINITSATGSLVHCPQCLLTSHTHTQTHSDGTGEAAFRLHAECVKSLYPHLGCQQQSISVRSHTLKMERRTTAAMLRKQTHANLLKDAAGLKRRCVVTSTLVCVCVCADWRCRKCFGFGLLGPPPPYVSVTQSSRAHLTLH